MKPVPFVVCFTLGVTLMVFSGYVPQAASARSNGTSAAAAPDPTRTDALPAPRSVTVCVPIDEPAEPRPSSTAAQVYTPAPSEVAAPTEPAPSTEPPASVTPPPPTPEPPPASPPSEDRPEPPLADAGRNRVVWAGWDELVLDGSASVGAELSYLWKQTGGPTPLRIKSPRQPATAVTGLRPKGRVGWQDVAYTFELTVTDRAGQAASDSVQVIVKTAPALRIRPKADQSFQLRDGYVLGHYVAWTTNFDSYETVFEIASDNELAFTKVAGSQHAVSGGRTEEGTYVYLVTVYGQNGDATSWVELLVDTDEQIPGIVQLGVSWDAR